MRAPVPRLDVVHTSPVVTSALRRELARRAPRLRLDTVVHSWDDFRSEWDFAGDVVLLDPFIVDHVPLPLKIRALRRLGSRVVVLGPGRDTPFARRCGAEGAIAWVGPDHGLAGCAELILDASRGTAPAGTDIACAPAPTARLTDRELQVLGLYVMPGGYSPAFLARLLRLRTTTVRSHLERGRARYRAAGVPTRGRAALRAAMVADGWVPEETLTEAAAPA
ncbi:helix-turn-helix transcriptional regulator [Janibacter corallicola]|uniref:helix-turn-helix transcriptional regulator n=1 Tax=Janibacter corallicola TaxID=415212 RepID=UPI0012EDC922|nr:hypothetical protein [Janibacter corallicola]